MTGLGNVLDKLSGHSVGEIIGKVAYRASSLRPVMRAERSLALARASSRTAKAGTAPAVGPSNRHLVITTAGNGNIGDQAMFESVLASTDGDVTAFVPSEDSFQVPAQFQDTVTLVDLGQLVDGQIGAAARARATFARYLQGAESLTVIGADVMDGGYQGREAALRLLCLELGVAAGLDCRIVGFSWSDHPDGYVVERFRGAPGALRMFSRDRVSFDRMTGDGIGGVELAADVVFTHRIDPEATSYSDWAQSQDSLAVINVSGLVLKRLGRQGQADSYLKEMGDTVEALVEQGYSVALLPHVVRDGDNDLEACRTVQERFAEDGRVLFIDRLLSPAEILGVVEHARVAVSARMHLGILTLTTGTPCVLFDTQGKVAGLMQEFGLSDCVLSPEDCTADTLLDMVGQARKVADESDALTLGREHMRELAATNFSGAATETQTADHRGIRELRAFADDPELQTHSGVYPAGAITEQPTLTRRGEYSDPRVADASLEEYASVAALGPLREMEDDLAERLFAGQQGAVHEEDIGWYTDLLTGHVVDEETRLASSSGGLATALLVELLESGEITGVIHMCPSDSDALFTYQISRTVDELRRGSRTRYYPGSLHASLEDVRVEDGRYAVVGIPSFISELRRLEDIEPILKERIRVHIGLVCGHQKSANYAQYLAWQAGISPGRLLDVDFRAKVPDKPANEYSSLFHYVGDDGKPAEKLMGQASLEGTNWGLGMFKSTFSDFSDDAFNETADIVFGDAWLPRFTSDYLGTNIVVVRDGRMGEVLSRMAGRGVVSLSACSEEDVVGSQTSLIRHSRREIGYRLSWFRGKRRAVPDLQRNLPEQPPVEFLRRGIQRQRARIAQASHDAFEEALARDSLRTFTVKVTPLTLGYRVLDRLLRLQKKVRARLASTS